MLNEAMLTVSGDLNAAEVSRFGPTEEPLVETVG